jgi:putative membrane protein
MAAGTQPGTTKGWGYPALLLASLSVIFIGLAIAPHHRQDWLLENLLVMVAVPILVMTRHRLRFSNLAYSCLFVFFSLHEIGAHYTYSLVPYDAWSVALTGHSLDAALGFERNHYDRLIHLLYGLLVTPAAAELFGHYGRYSRPWAALFPLLFVASHSVIYELVEWGAALAFGGELGQAFLGTQGDVWDAQKDMALALLGALISVTVLGLAGRLPVRKGSDPGPGGDSPRGRGLNPPALQSPQPPA